MERCQDERDPDVVGCLGEADPRYTIDLSPEGIIYFCAACGPRAAALNAALTNAFEEDPGFAEKLQASIDAVVKGDSN